MASPFSSRTKFLFLVLLVSPWVLLCASEEVEESKLYAVTGKVVVKNAPDSAWIAQTRVVIDGGKFSGYLKKDGSFVINGVPSGTYVVEVYTPNYAFEPVRVDVTKNGKIRGRKVNRLKLSAVDTLPYPLKFTAEAPARFFQQREKWSLLEMAKNNPMIMYLVIPLVLMFLLPKLLSNMDPDAQKEVQDSMSVLNQFQGGSMPSMEEWVTNLFGGGKKQPAKKPHKPLPASATAGGGRRVRK